MLPEGMPGAVAAAGTVEVAIERIKQIANTQVAAMADLTREEQQAFRNVELPPAAFGDVPEAQALGEQHRAAHQVFVETVAGVLADLEEFRVQLLASAQAHETTDEATYAAMSALGSRYQQHTFRSEQNYEDERAEQGDALRPAGGAEGGPDAGTPATAPPSGAGTTPVSAGDAGEDVPGGGTTSFSGGTV